MEDRRLQPVALILAVAAAAAFVWFARHVLLLLFSSLLVALIITSVCSFIRRRIPMPQPLAVGLVLLVFAGVVAVSSWLAADPVARQFDELAKTLPQRWSELHSRIKEWSTYEALEKSLPPADQVFSSNQSHKVLGAFSSIIEAGSSFAFISFAALFLASNPPLYRSLVIRLLPKRHEQRGDAVVQKSVNSLKSWLLGQLISMAVVGTITGAGLAIAGVPFALALGVIAGLAEFIPFVGPLVAAVPALLLAASLGTEKLLIVAGIMAAVQLLEGNVIMPIVQKKAVHLPPAITLAAVFLLGGAFGILGMFVAAPLVAVFLVLVDELYVSGYLKKAEPIIGK